MANAPEGGPAIVVGLGIGHLIVGVWNFTREIRQLTLDVGPVIAASLIGSVSVLVCLVGYWLRNSHLPAQERWLAGGGSVAGAVIIGGIIYISIVARLIEGRIVTEPVLILSLASCQGALFGSLVGVLYGQSRREAAAARRRKDQMEFVSSILRHDVRNSIMVIRSRAEMIAEEGSDRNREFAETILDRSEKVIGLSERVKEVASVVASDEALELEPVDIRPVVESQIETLRAETERVTIENDVADIAVIADQLFDEVVGNLLGNALTHGVDGEGEITITTATVGDRVRLRVADTGTGVSDDRKDEIFKRGESAGDGGFGLFFVKTIVDHYGGDIWVADRSDGRSGAVFVVELDQA